MCVIADHQGLSLCERGVLIADTRCMRRHQAVVGTYVSTRQERDRSLEESTWIYDTALCITGWITLLAFWHVSEESNGECQEMCAFCLLP